MLQDSFGILAPVQKLPINEAWDSVSLLVYQAAHKFARKYGTDTDETLSQARFHFCRSYPHYDPAIAKLTTFAFICVYRGLVEDMVKEAKHKARWHTNQVEVVEKCKGKRKFDFARFLGEVSEDAAVAIKLAVHSKRRAKRDVCRAVIEHLSDLGWSSLQVANTFREIREAIQ